MLILSPQNKSKIGSKEPENRQKLNYARGLIIFAQVLSSPALGEEASLIEPQVQATMAIDPKARALDLKEAFDFLRKEKTSSKVMFHLSDATTLSNVIEMTVMGSGTLILFKVNANQGIRLQVVPTENILTLSHS